MSRSYAFNWSPPFTHMGIQMASTFSDQWSGKFMLANGNDVFIDPSQEARFVGAVTYTSASKRDNATLGWSIGRAKFNAGDPFFPATVGLSWEPAGRNNFNAFDFVWNHTVNSKTTYSNELIYGYQTNVPANVLGGIIDLNRGVGQEGTAHWASWVQYLTYVINPKFTSVTRFELFEDFQGQRTGFEGLYTAITTGIQYRPTKSLLIRPEVRYDYNGYSKAFEGKNGIFTTALDVIVRW